MPTSVQMQANGRFGQLFATAVQSKGISLRELAARLDYTYEQMRKLYLGTSAPSPMLLKEICKILNMDLKEAQLASDADKAERKFGESAFTLQGRDPRLGDIESLLPQLDKSEWDMFVGQLKGYVHQKRRAK